MNHSGKYILYACLFILLTGFVRVCVSMAAPASPEVMELKQPDGTIFQAVQRGDEWNNRVETKAGYTIARGGDNYWRYVKEYQDERPVLAAKLAQQEAQSGTALHIRRSDMTELQSLAGERIVPAVSNTIANTSNGHILIILAEFSDQSGSTGESEWAAFLADNLCHYYQTVSYGRADLTPASESYGEADNGVVGWLNLGYDHPDTGARIDTDNAQLAKDAILAADAYVDYSQFDANGDGYVDGDELAIIVVVAGYDAVISTQVSPGVWSHKWSCSVVGAPVADGVIVADYHDGAGGYAQIGEYHAVDYSEKWRATMGPVVHELGHLIFRLPELYDSDDSSSGAGAWCVMSHGEWGKTASDTHYGETPVAPCAWVKYSLGWVDANRAMGINTLVAAGDESGSSANAVFLMSTWKTGEYFLAENRQPLGYDKGLERWLGENFRGGLAIWHVNETRSNNDVDGRRLVDLEEADGTQMGIDKGDVADLWFSGNGEVFNDTSIPNAKLSDLTESGIQLSDFSDSGAMMTFDFARYGDVNADNAIDLSDAVISLQILANTNASSVDVHADMNGDGKIGLEEALYVLTVIKEGRGTFEAVQ